MPTPPNLRNSAKGRLRYNKQPDLARLQHDLDQLSPPPLSRPHKEKASSKLNLSFGLSLSDFPATDGSPGHDSNTSSVGDGLDYNINALPHTLDVEGSEGVGFGNPDERRLTRKLRFSDAQETSLKKFDNCLDAPPTVLGSVSYEDNFESPLSPKLGFNNLEIRALEDKWASFKELPLLKHRAEFEHHNKALCVLMKSELAKVNDRLEKQLAKQKALLEQRQKQGEEEANKRLQQLKEDHQQHHEKINIRHQEIEKQRQLLEEKEKQMQEDKLKRLKEIFGSVEENRNVFAQLHDSYENKARLPEIVDKYRSTLDRVHEGLLSQVKIVQANPQSVTEELISKFGDHQDKSAHAVAFLKKQIAEADARLKSEEETKAKNELKKLEENQKREEAKKIEEKAAMDFSVQALKFVLEEKQDKDHKLKAMEKTVKTFVDNTEMKKYRFDLQRAVNTPINAISGIDSAHLKDKLQRLHALLSGHPVEVTGGKRVSAMTTPEGMSFCQNLVAKMLVRKGEEQVTSKHESAFSIGMVVVGLWCDFPVVGDLFMAHLQALCPYVLPIYNTKEEGQSSLDYHRSLGYKISEDNTIEEQDKFLRRMSGLMRLYCACMMATPPKGQNSPHPHGLENAWAWLARTMNLEPQPDVTAAMIYDLLSVTGYALFKEYRVQFAKLLYLLCKNYLPKLKNVSVTNATVGRLEIFLETALKTGTIPLPEGLLPPNFWFS